MTEQRPEPPTLTPKKRAELLSQGYVQVDPAIVRLVFRRDDRAVFIIPLDLRKMDLYREWQS